MKLNNNSRGFGAIEGLLVVILIVIVGFVGWYVWQAKQNTDTVLQPASTAIPVESNKAKDQQYAQFKDDKAGVSFEYPSTWNKPSIETNEGVVYYRMSSPDYKMIADSQRGELESGGSFSVMVNATSRSENVSSSFHDYSDIIKYHDSEGGIYGVGILADGNTTATTSNGVPAIRGAKCGHPGGNLDCLVFIKDQSYYEAYYAHRQSEASASVKYAPDYQHLLDTLKVN